MSDADKPKPTLVEALVALLGDDPVALTKSAVRIGRNAYKAYDAYTQRQEARADLMHRQVVEVFNRLARIQQRTHEAPEATRSGRGAPSEGGIDPELEELAAERARLQHERRLLRERQAHAREYLETERLRREVEAIEAEVLAVQRGEVTLDPPTGAAAERAVDSSPPSSTQPSPHGSVDEAPTSPEEAAARTKLFREFDGLVDALSRSGTASEAGDHETALVCAETASEGFAELIARYPEGRDVVLPLYFNALFGASTSSLKLRETLKASRFADEAVKAAVAVDAIEATIESANLVATAICHRGDVLVSLGRVTEALQLYEDARARVRELADRASDEEEVNTLLAEAVQIGRRCDALSKVSKPQTH
ncbi:MAG: hypothetical protein H6711_24935 [Myxococcales bacterium]|nr:hypothetical protein [Myxococcales bacterium]